MAYGICFIWYVFCWQTDVDRLSTIRSLPGARLGPDHRQVQASFIYPLSASGNPASLFWAWDVRLPPQAPHQPITNAWPEAPPKLAATPASESPQPPPPPPPTTAAAATATRAATSIAATPAATTATASLTWRVYQMKPFSSLKCRDGHPRYLEELVLFRKTMVPMDEGSSFHSDLSIML